MKKSSLPFIFVCGFLAGCAHKKIEAPVATAKYIAIFEQQKEDAIIWPIFEFNGVEWSSVYDQEESNFLRTWHVYSSEKYIGELNTSEMTNQLSAPGFQFKVDGKLQPSFQIETEKERFESWMGIPKFRPLLAMSDKLSIATAAIIEKSFPASLTTKLETEFRKVLPSLVLCDNPNSNKVINKEYRYKSSEIRFQKVYRNDSGMLVVAVTIDGKLNKCDGPTGGVYSEHWFVVDPKGAISFLGKSMWPVAMIISEELKNPWVFAYSGYNEDGYKIFYNNFKSSSSNLFKYH